ncbi:PhoX family protein [soil metagenome]
MLARLPSALLATVLAVTVAAGIAVAQGAPRSSSATDEPPRVIHLARGFHYDVLATAGKTGVRSTEDGRRYAMPEDFDANTVVPAFKGRTWLLSGHELTDPRPGDYEGDIGKAHVDELTAGDGDSNGWGSVTRLTLAPNGRKVIASKIITTGLHNLCAGAQTPWGTMLVNEEFPFVDDPGPYSGWVWEIDPATGASTRLTGMGRFSHEQEARARGGAWYLTDDFGDDRFLYRFVPDSPRDLVNGDLFGLVYDHAANTGRWVGPLDPLAPDADMRARGYDPAVVGFEKSEGMIATPSGKGIVFSESGDEGNPGKVWKLTQLRRTGVKGRVLVNGSFGRLSHPDNIRYTPAGDLLIYEDNGDDLEAQPGTHGVNQIHVLPGGDGGASDLVPFARTTNEPTGPWFSPNGEILYTSIQGDPSRVIAIHGRRGFDEPFKG